MQDISIGYDPSFEPLAFEHNGEAMGIVIERTSSILNQAGLAYRYSPVALHNMIPWLNSGQVQLITGVAANPQRQRQLQLSKALVITGGAWFSAMRARLPTEQKGPEKSPIPRSVITPESGPLVHYIEKQFPDIQLSTCADYPSALDYVLQGRADAAALNFQVGTRLCQNQYPDLFELPTRPFLTIPLTLASKRDDKSTLIKCLNSHIPDEWSTPAA